MATLLTTILPALIPGLSDGIRAIVRRIGGPEASEPANVEERIKLQDADTHRLEAIAKLDALVGVPSQWVIDLRGAYRYIAAGLVLLYGFSAMIYLSYANPALRPVVLTASFDLVQSVFFFSFGDRVYRTLKGK